MCTTSLQIYVEVANLLIVRQNVLKFEKFWEKAQFFVVIWEKTQAILGKFRVRYTSSLQVYVEVNSKYSSLRNQADIINGCNISDGLMDSVMQMPIC